MTNTHQLSTLIELYSSNEAKRLYDEVVTELEHALQCAAHAVNEDADGSLVAASLLHDVGHLVINDNLAIDEVLEQNFHHDNAGATFLATWFGPEVTEPVRLHVEAKRYLCAVDSVYEANLSPSSTRSLGVQGGAMSQTEVDRFEQLEHWEDAVALRRWDDMGKVADVTLPTFEMYLPLLQSLVATTR